MSFYDDASLVFLPSGGAGKDTKAYSIKPTNGDGDFTFSRGSNLTATRVDSNGLIEKGRENLLLQSNQFDTTWTTTSSITLTSGQSGYDGSSDAWLLERTSTGGQRVAQTISNSGVQTYSVYAKANVGDWLYIRCNTSGSPVESWYDLSNGVIGTSSNTIDTEIESIASGWYRCSISFIASTTEVRFYPTDGNGSNDGTNESIYIQDAQLEQGLVATEYIESGASTGKAGILEDSPRFDYSGGASCPSLLLEPSRTNIIEYSEYFSGFSQVGPPTLNLENINSPEGVENAYSIVKRSAADNNDRVQQSLGGLGTNHIFSIFLKLKSTTDTFNVRLANNQGERVEAVVSTDGTMVAGGAITAANYDIEDYGNGWYRLWMETTTSATSNFYQLYPNITNTSVGKCNFYGAQVEEGSYSSSYIPNHSGGSVTREADVNTLLNQSGVIGQTEGTIFFDAYFDEADKVNFSISDSTSSNYILIDTTSGKQVFARVQQGGSTQATIATSGSFFTEGDRLKCAVSYSSNNFAFYINGAEIGTDTSGNVPACDDVRFSRWNGALAANQRVNQALLFPTALSDVELTALTS